MSESTIIKPVTDCLSDRMKNNYELRFQHFLPRRIPAVVRVDGKAFHTLCRGLQKPFDMNLIRTMVYAAMQTAADIQGCKLAYVQSDEVSFLITDYDTLTTEAWFGYNQSKMESIAAATMTSYFNMLNTGLLPNRNAVFDARAFSIPESEAANYFLWRAKDWERNSVAMYCRKFFSSRQMHGKGKADQHEMLHGIGKNWTTDLTDQIRNGAFVIRGNREWRIKCDIPPRFDAINSLIAPLVSMPE